MSQLDKLVDYVLTTEGEDRFFALCVIYDYLKEHDEDLQVQRVVARTLIKVANDPDKANVSIIMPELADLMDRLESDESLQEEFVKLQDEVSLVMLWVNNNKTREAICRIMDHDLGGSQLGFLQVELQPSTLSLVSL